MKPRQLLRLIVPIFLLSILGLVYGIIVNEVILYTIVGVVFGFITFFIERVVTNIKFDIIYSFLGGIAGFYLGTLLDTILKDIFSALGYKSDIKPFIQLAFSYIGFFTPIFVKGLKPFYAPSIEREISHQEQEISPYRYKILDTSAIIDGRISEIAKTGFLDGVIYVPKFVLHEIQMLADSQENTKRNRARRSLDILNELKEIPHVNLKIITRDYENIHKTDEKLLRLAKDINGAIITNDYNLNKVARIEGIKVLNINDLAVALRQIYLPGEKLTVQIMKEGKEKTQGVGYLPDGTMIVLENGREYIGKEVEVKVTSVLQTSSGRIIFTQLDDDFQHPNQKVSQRTVRR
ncbi:MAG: TRAM domain-containing protein [Brevinematales bacterium]|nr:TRAM domain-containing protein [Brevinematales bacterium]